MARECARCGRQSHRPNRKTCQHCSRQCCEAAAVRRARLTAAGLCNQCGRVPFEPGRTKCQTCLSKHNGRVMASYAAKKAERKCVVAGCNAPAEGQKGKCERHLAYDRSASKVLAQQRFVKGLCQRCGTRRKRKGRLTCGPCGKLLAARSGAEYRRRIEAGLCTRPGCRKPPEPGLRQCAEHRAEDNKRIASRRTDDE